MNLAIKLLIIWFNINCWLKNSIKHSDHEDVCSIAYPKRRLRGVAAQRLQRH